jgi:glycosyltransferase involved in cell wall biosynthesis
LKILVLSDTYPWPARDGYRLRLDHVIGGLLEAGSVDLFAAIEPALQPSLTPEMPRGVSRVAVVPLSDSPRDLRLATSMLRTPLPRRIPWRDWSSARDQLEHFVDGGYDLVWFSHADTWLGLSDQIVAPAIVDLDNLEDFALRAHLATNRLQRLRPRELAKRVLDHRDVPLWTRAQDQIAMQADCCVVCSKLDRRRLGAPRSAVVPNGYDDPGPPPEEPVRDHVVVMVGLFRYGPNATAATWFAREVLPRLRQLVADVELRLVGRHDGALDDVSGQPGVRVLGEVDDVGAELRHARVAAVPVLAGSGTRVKVIEALAYGVPLVTTSAGCEGIDVRHGKNVLVADDAGQMAAACARLLEDDEEADALRTAGRALFLESYQWRDIQKDIAQLARTVAEGGGSGLGTQLAENS